MAMDNMRNRPLGHDIVEISDDDDDDDVMEVAAIPPRQIRQPRRNNNLAPANIDSEGDSPMPDGRPRSDEPQLGFPPNPPRVLPQPDPNRRAVPIVRIPRYDPFSEPTPSPNRQQGFKRQRSKSPLGRLPAKRHLLVDGQPALYPNLEADRPNWLGRERDREMFEADLRRGQFGEPLAAAWSPPEATDDGTATAADIPGFSKEACLQGLLALFPDISPDYVSDLWQTKPDHRSVEGLVNLILQEIDAGRPYAKIQKEVPAIKLKQKQAPDNENYPDKKYLAKNRLREDFRYGTES